MTAPQYTDILKSFSHYQQFQKEKYYIFIKILDGYFLICIDEPEENINNIFNWIEREQEKKYKTFMGKPIKCLFNTKNKYKSLLSNKGQKINYILESIDEYSNCIEYTNNASKQEILQTLKNILTDIKTNKFQSVIKEEIDTASLNRLSENMFVELLLYHYNFIEFLLTFEVPYVVKNNSIIYIFNKKESEKFLFDLKFLYYVFNKNTKDKALELLLMFKNYSINRAQSAYYA